MNLTRRLSEIREDEFVWLAVENRNLVVPGGKRAGSEMIGARLQGLRKISSGFQSVHG